MRSSTFVLIALLALASCGESSQGGVINDGIEPVDPNGALVDSTKPWDPAIDSARGEGRVDIQPRGSTRVAPQPLNR
jgi:hypothetical protein